MLFQFIWWLPSILLHYMICLQSSTAIFDNWNEKWCSKSNILTMDHELVLQNSSSAAVINTLLNTIIYLKLVKYLNKNTDVVVVFIFLEHNSICRKMTDSNYFYTEESILCRNFRVCITPFVCMLCAWLQACLQFVKACISLIYNFI